MSSLTEKEIEQYDRQIRLWGVDAQRRMRDARVLVVGLGALGAEVSKNLLLAGVNCVLVDAVTVEMSHLGAGFFLRTEDVGRNVRRSRERRLSPPIAPLPCQMRRRGARATSTAFDHARPTRHNFIHARSHPLYRPRTRLLSFSARKRLSRARHR
jgi:molybdopterin/thiamine biosynthesis adenylyltransferase